METIEKIKAFVEDLEYHYTYDSKDVILFIDIDDLKKFIDCLTNHFKIEEGFDCKIKENFICIPMKDILDYYNIELKEIFPFGGEE